MALMTGDIWDIYQQMQPGGWSPPSGIEGYTTPGWSMTFQKPEKPTKPGEPNPPTKPPPTIPPPNSGGQEMPKSNFPNAYSDFTDAQRQSMALAQARQTMNPQQFQSQFPNAVPQGGRKGKYDYYTLPSGAMVSQAKGAGLPSGYSQASGAASGALNAPFYSDVPQTSVSPNQNYYGGAPTGVSQPQTRIGASSILNDVNQTMSGFFPSANSQSTVGTMLARPPERPTPFGYGFGQRTGRQVRNAAWNTYAGASNLGIGATNFARPVYNALRGAFGLQPSQPMRYFDTY